MSEGIKTMLIILSSIIENILKIIEITLNTFGITDKTTISILTVIILIAVTAMKVMPRRSRRR